MFWRKRSPWRNCPAAAFNAILAVVLAPLQGVAQQPRDRWAGIEIGSSGAKLVVLDARPGPVGIRFEDVVAKDLPGNITANLVKNNGVTKFAPEAIERTVEAVRQLRDVARQHKVDDDHIYVVASSGVAGIGAQNMDGPGLTTSSRPFRTD